MAGDGQATFKVVDVSYVRVKVWRKEKVRYDFQKGTLHPSM
jgi:hypothetical protein